MQCLLKDFNNFKVIGETEFEKTYLSKITKNVEIETKLEYDSIEGFYLDINFLGKDEK